MHPTTGPLTNFVAVRWRHLARGSRALLVAGIAVTYPAIAQEWPDSVAARLAAEANLSELSVALLSRDSATLVLDEWCSRHRIDPAAEIVAERVRTAQADPPPEVRAALRLAASETVAHRHVLLKCGARILSEADNWYVPGRLTPAINHALDTTDIAFGRAALTLRFKRSNISSSRLWSPLPAGWEHLPEEAWPRAKTLAIPPFVLENRAVLVVSRDLPISFVIERYTRQVLPSVPPVVADTIHRQARASRSPARRRCSGRLERH